MTDTSTTTNSTNKKQLITVNKKDQYKKITSFTMKSSFGFHSYAKQTFNKGINPKMIMSQNFGFSSGFSTSHLTPAPRTTNK